MAQAGNGRDAPDSSGLAVEGVALNAAAPAPAAVTSVLSSAAPIYNWVEVTDEFAKATKELSLGELLHDDSFGLFEAMSAIEMMDPKMDAGMRCNRQAARPHSFQTALESGHLKAESMSDYEMLGVADDTLCCLVTWLEGHSLAQTVFTNLYLHRPFEVGHPPARAFSVAVLKLVDIIKDLVSRGTVYEEEDFQPVTYCFKLAQEVSETRAGGMLREVEDELQKVLRSTKAKDGQQRDEKTLKEHELAGALFSRFRFLRQLYQGLVALLKGDVTEGRRALQLAREQLPNIAATVGVGRMAEPGQNQMGFDRLANQRLLPPTFPRYTEIRSRAEAAEYFKRLVDNLINATAIVQVGHFHAALEFFVDYSSSSPCVLSRSCLQVLFAPISGAELLREACKTFIAPPVLMGTSRSPLPPPLGARQLKDCVDGFLSQCCRPMSLLLQAFGHNRARQRDKLAGVLEEFTAVQEEADKLDNMLNALTASAAAAAAAGTEGVSSVGSLGKPGMLYFSTWLLYHVLRIMVRYILSGFELELYSQHEYPYLFWYLYELLFPWLTNCLQRADSCLQEHELSLESQQKTAGKNKKKVKGGSGKKNKSTPRPYAREIAHYQGYGILCAGYFKLLAAMKKEQKVVLPNPTLDNESVRYEHRFAPFANLLTPPLMPYGQYMEIYSLTCQTNSCELFVLAAKDFARSRQIFETLLSSPRPPPSSFSASPADLEALVSVCKVNFVASSVLARDPAGRSVDFDFAPHSTFPSVRII